MKRHYAYITILPFIRKRALEMLRLNQVLLIQSCVQGVGETCNSHDSYKASFIYQRYHLFVHSFVHSTTIYLFRTFSRALGQALGIWGRRGDKNFPVLVSFKALHKHYQRNTGVLIDFFFFFFGQNGSSEISAYQQTSD